MDVFVRRFIRSSLCWLGFGVLLGISMAILPSHVVYRPAHVHANLLGFVSMMIFGVAYHVVPRFTGQTLHNPQLAAVHVILANAGLGTLVAGWLLRPHGVPGWSLLLATGGLVSATGAFCFIYNIWRTLDAATHARVLKTTTNRKES
jgi:cytochrome c oxidase cbb3-type subunit 1